MSPDYQTLNALKFGALNNALSHHPVPLLQTVISIILQIQKPFDREAINALRAHGAQKFHVEIGSVMLSETRGNSLVDRFSSSIFAFKGYNKKCKHLCFVVF